MIGLGKRLDAIEKRILHPEPAEPERWKFFAVFVGETWREHEPFETYVSLEVAPWSPIGEHEHCGAEDLDKYESQGVHCALLFDPFRCAWEAYTKTGYLSTPEGTPERAAEEAAHAAVFPELKPENLYRWVDVKAGQFLAQIEAKRGAKFNSQEGAQG